jgi:hypothetical protein
MALQKLAPRLGDLPAAPPRTARQPRPLQPVVRPSRPVPVDRLRTAGQPRFDELVVGGNGQGLRAAVGGFAFKDRLSAGSVPELNKSDW